MNGILYIRGKDTFMLRFVGNYASVYKIDPILLISYYGEDTDRFEHVRIFVRRWDKMYITFIRYGADAARVRLTDRSTDVGGISIYEYSSKFDRFLYMANSRSRLDSHYTRETKINPYIYLRRYIRRWFML